MSIQCLLNILMLQFLGVEFAFLELHYNTIFNFYILQIT